MVKTQYEYDNQYYIKEELGKIPHTGQKTTGTCFIQKIYAPSS